MDIEEREIELTQIGLLHYNTQFYLRQSIKEKNEIALLESSLKTNRNVRWTNRFIWITMAAATTTAIFDYKSYNLEYEKYQKERLKDTLVQDQKLKLKEINSLIFLRIYQSKKIDSLRNILNDKTYKLTTINDKKEKH